MKILWIHNFNPDILNAGVFMHQAYEHLKREYGHKHEFDMLYLGNLRNPLKVAFAMIKLAVIGLKYDVTHAQFGSMCALVGRFSLSRHRVVTLRGSDWHDTSIPTVKRGMHHRLQNILTRSAMHGYHSIITVSERMSGEVKAKYPRAATIVIPSPVDPEKFYPTDKLAARGKLGLPLDKRIFLFPVMSKTNPVKRPWLIEEVRCRLPPHIEIITASGVRHDDMRDLYNAVDGVVLVSYYEGWPNVIKEALMCNVPFIATDVSDLASIAQRHPSCKIVPPTAEDLLEALIHFQPPQGNLRDEVSWMDMEHMNRKLVDDCYERLT